jgi:iron(III) transport system permease protein
VSEAQGTIRLPYSAARGELRSARAFRGWTIMGAVYALLALCILYPLGMIFAAAFAEEGLGATVEEIFSSDVIFVAFRNTVLTSLIGVGIAGFFGVMLAWLVGRTNMPFKRVLDPLNLVPFYLSSIVGALCWQVLCSPRSGLLNVWLEPLLGRGFFNIYSIGGIGFVLGLYFSPYVYLFTLGSLQSMDASLEEASRVSGASTLQTALKVTLPLSAPAILSAWLLVFVHCMGIFGVPIVLGTPGRVNTLSTLMYSYINDYPANFSVTAVIGIFLFVTTLALTLLQMQLLAKRRFTTITGKGYKPRIVELGRWRYAALGVNCLYLLLVIGPLIALLLVSLQDVWTGAFEMSRVTLRNYVRVLFEDATAKRGLVNSMVIAFLGATIAVLVCLVLSLIIQRTRLPLRQGIYSFSMIPAAIPGVVLGVGYLIAVVGTPLYGTLWVIMIAYIINYLPTGVRNIDSLVQSISHELDESARTSGASWWKAMSGIILPICIPGLASAWILMFVTFIREVSASMMLFTYGTETMSIALIRITETQPWGVASAFGVLQTLLLLGCVIILRAIPVGPSKQSTEQAA